MKSSLFSIVFLLTLTLNAQVGIGTTTPRASLEISNTDNGGLLVPHYELTGNNDSTTVVNPQPSSELVAGTIVYNTKAVTGTNAIGIGFVYWDGSLWQKMAVEKEKSYGEIYNATNYNNITLGTPLNLANTSVTKNVTTTSNSISTSTAGVYRVTYTVSMEQISGGGSEEVEFFLAKNGTEVPGTRVYIDVSQNPDFATMTRVTYVKVSSANQTFTVRPNQSNTNVIILSGTSLSVELID